MIQLANKKNTIPGALSVSYKFSTAATEHLNSLPEAVIVTDLQFFIKGLNDVAASIYGFTAQEAAGKKLFDLLEFEMIGIERNEAIQQLFLNGFWKGDI